ncbi:MAG TPA: ornithine carbamoyltransferase [Gammaproteobacteria bacterium]|nr:ornithine carbamoyltransferase [Gammaproteobacteria bacterium]
MPPRHLVDLADLSPAEIRAIIARASELKRRRAAGDKPPIFERKVLAMIFEKSSTRTRVSFEAAMIEGGGGAIFLAPKDTQLGRGEPIEDTARVLSEMCDAIMVRTFAHSNVERLAACASVPVINGLTDRSHPCQLLADLQTYVERRGDIAGRKVAWIGDGNNMCNTYIEAAALLDFELAVATPAEYEPDALRDAAASRVRLVRDPFEAAAGADLIVTDVWISMGQEAEAAARRAAFAPYQVSAALMACAKADALFMHCLPAHRGEEVAAEVIDAADSVVWEEAGNRLHAQKALLEFLFGHAG